MALVSVVFHPGWWRSRTWLWPVFTYFSFCFSWHFSICLLNIFDFIFADLTQQTLPVLECVSSLGNVKWRWWQKGWVASTCHPTPLALVLPRSPSSPELPTNCLCHMLQMGHHLCLRSPVCGVLEVHPQLIPEVNPFFLSLQFYISCCIPLEVGNKIKTWCFWSGTQLGGSAGTGCLAPAKGTCGCPGLSCGMQDPTQPCLLYSWAPSDTFSCYLLELGFKYNAFGQCLYFGVVFCIWMVGETVALTVLALCIPKIGFCILGMNYLGDRWKEQLPAVFLINACIFYIDSDFFPPLHLLACSYSILV